jgi:hypothetical protein
MFNPLIHRGDFTLADGGNDNFRIDGSSLDGLMAGGVSRKWQKPGPELTVVKPARLFPKVELHLSGSGLDSAAPPRSQRRGLRRGEKR